MLASGSGTGSSTSTLLDFFPFFDFGFGSSGIVSVSGFGLSSLGGVISDSSLGSLFVSGFNSGSFVISSMLGFK